MRILITGASGQIGGYVADLLLARGHEVLGSIAPDRAPLSEGVKACGNLDGAGDVDALLGAAGSLDAVIHLAGQSSVAASWSAPLATFEANAGLTVALVAALKGEKVRLVHASSAEIFGAAATPVQDESTPISPVSPYGVAKAAAHLSVRVGREGYGAPMSNLVFYLGESERRPPTFVFRKITRGLAAVSLGRAEHITLGNTAIVRDFCHAKDLAEAACLFALGAPPGDYVCASGEGHSIAQVATTACEILGLDPSHVIRSDDSLFRPSDAPSLVGNSKKLRSLGWSPTVSFQELVARLVAFDLEALRAESPNP
jgi:GDPmannose 4,6-dehydratase